MKRFLLFFWMGCVCLLACKSEQTPPEANDVVVATVHGKPLYLSEVLFMEIPKNSEKIKEANRLWKEHADTGSEALKDFAAAHSTQFIMSDSAWYRPDYLMTLLPEEYQKRKNFANGTELTFSDDNFKYYLSILGRIPKGEVAPMEYVIEQMSSVILHKRKIALLDEKREEIYEREINRNTIKVYN